MAEDSATTLFRLARPLGPLDLDIFLESEAPRIGVMGPSGSGKSTLLRILAGVDNAARGFVRMGGLVLQDSAEGLFTPPWQRRVGWLPQDSLVFPHRTVQQNLEHASTAADAVMGIAEALEVDPLLERSSSRLSGGEAQRVALGRALLSRPERFLLDEPFSALDQELKARVMHFLDGALEQRPTVVVSHDRALLESLGAELWTMDRGRVQRL